LAPGVEWLVMARKRGEYVRKWPLEDSQMSTSSEASPRRVTFAL
jgi:hypothetical protein